jgi:inhibitor of KinA
LTEPWNIKPLNENAALISFQNAIDIGVNNRVIVLDHQLKEHPFSGFIETVPAYSSLAVFYDSIQVRSDNPKYETAFSFVKEYIENNFKNEVITDIVFKNKPIEVPVLYDGEDLEYVSDLHTLTKEEVIKIHTSSAYRVFMIGFLPGFAYMGTLDDRIVAPRKSSPRTRVPAGSVGIAGLQTGIYPQTSPGGWQLIGRTPIKIFDKQSLKPCLFSPGHTVCFYSIDQNVYNRLHEY